MTDESNEPEQVDYFARNDDDFSKTSTEWLTLGDLIKIEKGEVSIDDFLREACDERELDAPTDDELEAFKASFAAQQEEMRKETAIWASNLQPLKELQKRLAADVGNLPAAQSEMAKLSKSVAAAMEMTNSPVFEAARSAMDSSAVRAAQRVFNDPVAKAAMEAASSPIVRQQLDDARRKIDLSTVGMPSPIFATVSKPRFDQSSIVFDPVPSTFSAVREMHEAMVTEQSTANEALNTVADLLNVLVVGAAETGKAQVEAERRQLAWNEKFKKIYIATLVVAIIAGVTAVVSIIVTVNAQP